MLENIFHLITVNERHLGGLLSYDPGHTDPNGRLS